MQDLKIIDDFKLKIQIQIAWADMDALGHVNSSKYFAYFESARIRYYETLDLLNYFSSERISGVLARTDCSYFVPLTYPDTLIVGARVTDLFEDYIIMEYFIKSLLKGLSAIGEAEIVFYNFEKNRKISVPKKVKDEVAKYENYTIL